MAIPRNVYITAVKDLQRALENNKFTFVEWFERFKAICDEFQKEYQNETLSDILSNDM